MLVLDEGQTGQGDGSTATRAQPEAELDVGHTVETEPRIEPACRECIGAAKSQAVALDRVDVGTWAGVEFFERALAAQPERPRHGDGRVGEGIEERRYDVPFQFDAGVEEDHVLPGRILDARIDRGSETERWVERDDAKAFRGAVLEPARDSRVTRVVDQDCFEVSLAMREGGKQPALGVRLPAMDDREQGDVARRSFRVSAGRGLDRLQIAAVGAVQDIPSARAQLLANRIRGLEITVSPALDALVEKLLGGLSIRSSWL